MTVKAGNLCALARSFQFDPRQFFFPLIHGARPSCSQFYLGEMRLATHAIRHRDTIVLNLAKVLNQLTIRFKDSLNHDSLAIW